MWKLATPFRIRAFFSSSLLIYSSWQQIYFETIGLFFLSFVSPLVIFPFISFGLHWLKTLFSIKTFLRNNLIALIYTWIYSVIKNMNLAVRYTLILTHSFIHPFSKYLLSMYRLTSTILIGKDTASNKIKFLPSLKLYSGECGSRYGERELATWLPNNLCYFLVIWPCVSHFTSLSFKFLNCTMEKITTP